MQPRSSHAASALRTRSNSFHRLARTRGCTATIVRSRDPSRSRFRAGSTPRRERSGSPGSRKVGGRIGLPGRSPQRRGATAAAPRPCRRAAQWRPRQRQTIGSAWRRWYAKRGYLVAPVGAKEGACCCKDRAPLVAVNGGVVLREPEDKRGRKRVVGNACGRTRNAFTAKLLLKHLDAGGARLQVHLVRRDDRVVRRHGAQRAARLGHRELAPGVGNGRRERRLVRAHRHNA